MLRAIARTLLMVLAWAVFGPPREYRHGGRGWSGQGRGKTVEDDGWVDDDEYDLLM